MFIEQLTDDEILYVSKRIFRKFHRCRYENLRKAKIEFCKSENAVAVKIYHKDIIDIYLLKDFNVQIFRPNYMGAIANESYLKYMCTKFGRPYIKCLKEHIKNQNTTAEKC